MQFSSQLIFFALIFISIDNESYNENINIISDLAYLIGFNTEMINDWIYVVKATLEYEKIDFTLIKSNSGKKFFNELRYESRF